MITIKKLTKKYKNSMFCELSTLSFKKLYWNNSLIFNRLSKKEIIELLSKLSMLNCSAVEHKEIIYLCKEKENYNKAIKQIQGF
jgi:hypothetical protein